MLDWVLNTPKQTDTLVNIWKENNQLDVMKYGIE